MRRTLSSMLVLLLCVLAERASAGQPFEGLWSTSRRTCQTDKDGVWRLEINPQGLFWYEERCRGPIRPEGKNVWTARLTCEGEGERRKVTTRLSLPRPDTLVMKNAPVTPTRRHSYVRCRTAE